MNKSALTQESSLTASYTACVLGSAIICVDIIVRHITRDKKFQIANSNNFLSASLCLSAGVMVSYESNSLGGVSLP